MKKLGDANTPTLKQAVDSMMAEQKAIMPHHAKVVAEAAIRTFVNNLDGKRKFADWLYRKFGRSRVDSALEETIEEIREWFE